MEAPFDSTKSSHDLMNFSGSASDMLAAMQVSLPYNSGVVLQVFHAYSLGTQVDFEAFLLYAYDNMIYDDELLLLWQTAPFSRLRG